MVSLSALPMLGSGCQRWDQGTLRTESLHREKCKYTPWACAGTQSYDHVQPGTRPTALGSTAWWRRTTVHAVLMALPASRGCHPPHASHRPTQWFHPTCSNPSFSPAYQARRHLKQPAQLLLPFSPAVTRKVPLFSAHASSCKRAFWLRLCAICVKATNSGHETLAAS